MTFSYCF